MLNLVITAGKVPFGTSLPGNAQALATFMSLYNGVGGAQNFDGVNFGPNTPTADNRDKPWFKTDAVGNPIGWFSWNGVAWLGIPLIAASGGTTGRPSSAGLGTEYYDTDIGALIIWNGVNWTTASGTIGDVKEVFLSTLAIALQNNPGWIQEPSSIGCVLAAAGPAGPISSAHNYGQVLGEEAHQLTVNELASHTHTVPSGGGGATADGNVGNPAGIISSRDSTATGSTGGDTGHNNIQPTYYAWRLLKTS